jgi:hypothetical protein
MIFVLVSVSLSLFRSFNESTSMYHNQVEISLEQFDPAICFKMLTFSVLCYLVQASIYSRLTEGKAKHRKSITSFPVDTSTNRNQSDKTLKAFSSSNQLQVQTNAESSCIISNNPVCSPSILSVNPPKFHHAICQLL